MIETKVCSRCKKDKPCEQFRAQTKGTGGLKTYCIACEDDYQRDYYSRNKEKMLETKQKYNANNKEKLENRRLKLKFRKAWALKK